MPANDHLQWVEIRDFSGGLWTRDSFLVPPNAAQEMHDCHPVPGGGLRAFYRRQLLSASTSPSNVGLDPANEVYLGMFANPSSGINSTCDHYIMAWNTSTRVPKLYHSNYGAWTVIKSFAATVASPVLQQSFFTQYVSSLTRKTAFNLNTGPTGAPGSADDGIWIVTGAGVPTMMTVPGTGERGPITAHQGRLVVASDDGLRWTDPGTETFQTSSVLAVEPQTRRPTDILMVGYAPSELLIGKEAGPLIVVQGDLGDPIVRAMEDSLVLGVGGAPGKTPAGLAVVAERDAVYVTSPGGGVHNISQQLSPDNFGMPVTSGAYTPKWFGDCLYVNGWLFTPSAVSDMSAWFSAGHTPGNTDRAFLAFDRSPSVGGVDGAVRAFYVNGNGGASAGGFYELDDTKRSGLFSFKSAPLRDPGGRQVEVREVQLYARTYDANATLDVTVGAATRNAVLAGAGRHQVTMLFREAAEVLDLRLVSTAGTSATNEAPTIETIRLGWQPRHLLR